MMGRKRVSNLLGTRFYDLLDYLILFITAASIIIFILWPIASVIKQSIIIDGRFSFEMYKSIFVESKRLIGNGIFVALLSTVFSTIISVYKLFKGMAKQASLFNTAFYYDITTLCIISCIY